MKKLLPLIFFIIIFSCKKEDIYKEKLIYLIDEDTKFINSHIGNKKLYLSSQHESYPEQYKVIIHKGKVLDSTLKSLSSQISNAKKEGAIKAILTNEINNLKKHIPEASHGIIQNLDSINNLNSYEFEIYKKIINYEIQKTKYKIYTALSSGRSTSCFGGGRMTSSIKTKRKNDSIVTITLTSAFIKNNIELFEDGFFYISKLNNNKSKKLEIVSEKRIFDVFSFDVLNRNDETINTKIDLFISKGNERQIFETLDTNIRINETKHFTPVRDELK